MICALDLGQLPALTAIAGVSKVSAMYESVTASE